MFKEEHDIVGVDKLGYASDSSAFNLCPSYKDDISSPDFIDKFKQINKNGSFDAIVNFAAESHVDNSINSPGPFMYSNFIGTYNMLEIVRRYNIKRFLQIGTDEVYGDLNADDPPFANLYEMKPSSPYSASKAAADLLVLSYCRTYNINGVVTRSCNNYGPYQYREKLIPVIITNLLNNKKIPIYGTGRNIREWIHVRDNCEGIMAALKFGESGGIYHMGSGVELTNLDIARQILSIMDKPETLISMVEDRPGHDFRYSLDSKETHSKLKWKPKIMLQDGLRETVEYYKIKLSKDGDKNEKSIF
jgi:dTDP-glucose 4,6-dehydratase